jgi:hypothetical protein
VTARVARITDAREDAIVVRPAHTTEAQPAEDAAVDGSQDELAVDWRSVEHFILLRFLPRFLS